MQYFTLWSKLADYEKAKKVAFAVLLVRGGTMA
jgi:hypothetical protein